MKPRIGVFLSMFILAALTSCATQQVTKIEAFPKAYQQQPLSILVLPPMNDSTAADAKEFYSTTIAEPLSLNGYYVYPLEVVSDILKNEGMFDTETLTGIPPPEIQ